MWDALFTQDTYVTSVTEEQSAPVTVLDKNLTPYSYKYACSRMLYQLENHVLWLSFVARNTLCYNGSIEYIKSYRIAQIKNKKHL